LCSSNVGFIEIASNTPIVVKILANLSHFEVSLKLCGLITLSILPPFSTFSQVMVFSRCPARVSAASLAAMICIEVRICLSTYVSSLAISLNLFIHGYSLT
jgi:hypothetical protein